MWNIFGGTRCFSTYYDSQSGLHVPLHKEKEISVILNVTDYSPQAEEPDTDEAQTKNNHTVSSTSGSPLPTELFSLAQSFLPTSTNVRGEENQVLQLLSQHGVQGLRLSWGNPVGGETKDFSAMWQETASESAAPGFTFYMDSTPYLNSDPQKYDFPLQFPSVSSLLPWFMVNENDNSRKDIEQQQQRQTDEAIQNHIQYYRDMGIKTTVQLGGEYNECDAMTVADKVAKFIDDTNGGMDYLWLIPPPQDGASQADDVVQLCEELMYLDVPGPTLQSRIIVDCLPTRSDDQGELIEDTMSLGINKFVLHQESQLDIVREIAQSQGKTLGQHS